MAGSRDAFYAWNKIHVEENEWFVWTLKNVEDTKQSVKKARDANHANLRVLRQQKINMLYSVAKTAKDQFTLTDILHEISTLMLEEQEEHQRLLLHANTLQDFCVDQRPRPSDEFEADQEFFHLPHNDPGEREPDEEPPAHFDVIVEGTDIPIIPPLIDLGFDLYTDEQRDSKLARKYYNKRSKLAHSKFVAVCRNPHTTKPKAQDTK